MVEETTQPMNWKEKIAETLWKVKLGERANNLDKDRRRFNNTESLIMATREKLMGKDIVDNNRPEGEEMHIGDDNSSVTNQYIQPPKGSTLGTLAKVALIGAGVATGAGVGVPAGLAIWNALKDKPAAPVSPSPTTDIDTLYNLRPVK